MFTSDNSDFPAADCLELNAALVTLLSGVAEKDYAQLSKTYSDLLNNAWHDGDTANVLLNKIQRRIKA